MIFVLGLVVLHVYMQADVACVLVRVVVFQIADIGFVCFSISFLCLVFMIFVVVVVVVISCSGGSGGGGGNQW
jgi:hypothetical protein